MTATTVKKRFYNALHTYICLRNKLHIRVAVSTASKPYLSYYFLFGFDGPKPVWFGELEKWIDFVGHPVLLSFLNRVHI